MILVFGGTTEGRRAAEVLEEAGSLYYYSTKTGEQELTLHHGVRIDGALDAEAMKAFCQQHEIRLIVDAAHPFATMLHQTIADVASDMQIPVVRYERIYPPRDPDITWIDDYNDIIAADLHGQTLLATTGVQSISKLKWLEAKGVKVIYRILNRESSIWLAHQQGATDDQLCFYHTGDSPQADAILLKESGLSGGFVEKVEEAKANGMRIIALKRPESTQKDCIATPHSQRENATLAKREPSLLCTVNGPYGLRRAVEKLLPEFYPLHSGLTTGTCATAAAVAATIRLTKGETPAEVPVLLPNGETITVPVGYADGYAYCIKEAGDDPDVTNGIEIRAKVSAADDSDCNATLSKRELFRTVRVSLLSSAAIEIEGGEGVGRFTLPGFDYPPGDAPLNKGPRQMIEQNLQSILSPLLCQAECGVANPSHPSPLKITISVPDGEEIAKRTFNPRLGIEGGISIIGVSGIVKPFSEEAFIDSIRKCVQVALASGTDRIVINSGGKSERFVKALYPTLPQQAFVEYGNYIGETLRIIADLSLLTSHHSPLPVTLGVMLGKAVKLAAGNLDTHSRKTTMDKAFIQQMLQEAGISIDISDMTLARELWERIPQDKQTEFACTVIRHCEEHCKPLLPNGQLTILLIDDDGTIHSL